MAGYGDSYSELTGVFPPQLWSPQISSTVAFSHTGYGRIRQLQRTDGFFPLSCGLSQSAQQSHSDIRIHVNSKTSAAVYMALDTCIELYGRYTVKSVQLTLVLVSRTFN